MRSELLLFAAGLGVAWLVLALYIATLANRHRKLSQEISRLKNAMGR
jgi:CcmD family protein